ncbi:MAG: hypothetical protein GXO64_02150 [Candidatus Micrarchaeota archaeon]|nr:hypothetical protein [Candidatus Micrarchaeota archaeon]
MVRLRFALLFVFVLIMSYPIAKADPGDPVYISSQSPENGFNMGSNDNNIILSFSFTGDYANCSLYGNWSSGWGVKNNAYTNITEGSHDYKIVNTLLVCDNTYLWNVYCVESDNGTNNDWGENRSFWFPCPQEEVPIVPQSNKVYSIILKQPWEGYAGLGDRWIVHDENNSIYNIRLVSITDVNMTFLSKPANENHTISLITPTADIDLDGNGSKDVTMTLNRLYAWTNGIITIKRFGFVENSTTIMPENGTSNQTVNESITNGTIANETGINATFVNVTTNITNTTMRNVTNITIKSNITKEDIRKSDKNASADNATQPPQYDKKPKKGQVPLWIILLIFTSITVVVIFFAYKMMGPATV